METAISSAKDVLVGGKEDRVVVGDKAFRVTRSETVVTELPIEASVAAHQNATSCSGVIEAVGAKDAPDIAPLRTVHGLPLRLDTVEKECEGEKKK